MSVICFSTTVHRGSTKLDLQFSISTLLGEPWQFSVQEAAILFVPRLFAEDLLLDARFLTATKALGDFVLIRLCDGH